MNRDKNLITKLEIVPLRKAFPNEARDLTPWLAENIDALNDRLRLSLSIEQTEMLVGDFKVDLLCQDWSVFLLAPVQCPHCTRSPNQAGGKRGERMGATTL